MFTIPVGTTRFTVRLCGKCVVSNPQRTHEWLRAKELELTAQLLASRPKPAP